MVGPECKLYKLHCAVCHGHESLMKYFCLYLLFPAHLSVTLQALLENDGSQAIKQRGLRVIRAVVTKTSSLIGKRVSEVDFRKTFKAAIIAIQKNGNAIAIA